jgi:zinc/manganese transport system ATP-binding protein
MTSETLSELYRTKIDVVRVRGQIHVVGAQSGLCEDQTHHLHEERA